LTRRDEAAAGWGAEGAEGAAVETDVGEGPGGPGAAAVEDEVVARAFARCEVGHFEAELGDGAEGCEHAVRRWVEVCGSVLSCGRGEGQGVSRGA
jgi:hypothetical protein